MQILVRNFCLHSFVVSFQFLLIASCIVSQLSPFLCSLFFSLSHTFINPTQSMSSPFTIIFEFRYPSLVLEPNTLKTTVPTTAFLFVVASADREIELKCWRIGIGSFSKNSG